MREMRYVNRHRKWFDLSAELPVDIWTGTFGCPNSGKERRPGHAGTAFRALCRALYFAFALVMRSRLSCTEHAGEHPPGRKPSNTTPRPSTACRQREPSLHSSFRRKLISDFLPRSLPARAPRMPGTADRTTSAHPRSAVLRAVWRCSNSQERCRPRAFRVG